MIQTLDSKYDHASKFFDDLLRYFVHIFTFFFESLMNIKEE